MTYSGTRLVVGIPTVARSRDYVGDTVKLLLDRGGPALGDRAHIVVMNAEDPPEAHRAVSVILSEHGEAIARGVLRLTTVPERDLAAPPAGRGPATDVGDWQRKQVLHASALMESCAAMGSHYLHLEDDVVPAPDYLDRVLDFLEAQERVGGWHALGFYSSNPVTHGGAIDLGEFWGFIGVLFRTRDLPPLTAELRRRYDEGPIDHLVRRYLHEHRFELRAHVPSLFEHVGFRSSLPTKIQSDRSWRFAGDRTSLHRILRLLHRSLRVRWLRWGSRTRDERPAEAGSERTGPSPSAQSERPGGDEG